MKFRTAYCEHKRFNTPSGSRYRITYQKVIDKDGCKLVAVGKEDVFDSIQKAGLGLTVDDLIRRAQNGDSSAIPLVVDSFADLTNAPKDILEAHAMLTSARQKYESLPLELRSKFDNSFEKFLQAAADGSAFKELLTKKAPPSSVDALTPDEIAALRKTLVGGNDA